MKNKGKTKFIVILIFCLIFTAALLFIGYGVTEISRRHYTEENTKEYTAEFKSKEYVGNNYYNLYIHNSECYLLIETEPIINETEFYNLTDGDTITFRSVFNFEEARKTGGFITIQSLKTADAEIMTLESSQTTVTKNEAKVRITSTVFAAICVIGAVVCVLYLANIFPLKKR